ncbi:MAG: hypothetical protein LBG88_00630 [Christensenellaceae bacterium]|nr:hypothetical protein [Christensenellaceae bacterium]
MKRKVLLIEPNYRNKYPPMGLMKLATYFRERGDDVRFFKGSELDLRAEVIYDRFMEQLCTMADKSWCGQEPLFFRFIRHGKNEDFDFICKILSSEIVEQIQTSRKNFKNKDYIKNNPVYDFVGVTTLFTFYWSKTIETINFANKFRKPDGRIMVGGIMASLLPDEIELETGIRPFERQLDKPGIIDEGDTNIIDELPLDYSILEEVEYKYPAHDAYFAYMTRGCTNKCGFCAVPKLEPEFKHYIGLEKTIAKSKERFGEQRNLLLLDNNVLASKCYSNIIDEIKRCGFQHGATYIPESKYEIAIKNLRDNFNERAYIRVCVDLYKELIKKLTKLDKQDVVAEAESKINGAFCSDYLSASKEKILELDSFMSPLFAKYFKRGPLKRIIDFNQGVDARLITQEKMDKLAETNISPLRIAFDQWAGKETYEASVRMAAKSGIRELSNYMLYNFNDKPEELFLRMKLNIDLCEELKVSIFSFPMKYHPITGKGKEDEWSYKDRKYTGKHWNRKFIRAIQAVLNSTKGKIGKGKRFFEVAFGKDEKEFEKILYMPEAFIIYREENKKNGGTGRWWRDYRALPEEKLSILKGIVEKNNFSDISSLTDDKDILKVLKYYTFTRKDTEDKIKGRNNG